MEKSNSETNVRVFTRVRPLLPKEKLNGEESCVRVNVDTKQIIIGKDRVFTFDGIFSPKTSQDDVYKTAVNELVKNIFDGYNSTIFAYGQTGSGKTYTMGTFNQEELLRDEKGIVPRAVEHIFKLISERESQRKFTITASFIEVYKEEVRDLLDPTGSCSAMSQIGQTTGGAGIHENLIQIREDEHGNTILSGVYEHLCEQVSDLLECLEIGSSNRVTGATQMNEYSSRSHCVFTVNIIQEWSSEYDDASENSTDPNESALDNEFKNIISGKFHFVDLAGSERAHKTGNVGDRFKESIHINSGLLALGNVISALGDPKKKKGIHIPYRESKITRILKDSLGGNARTLMICCISPAVSNYDETVNALKYANRARNIRNKPIVNHDKATKQIVRMQTEIMALREQLSRQKASSLTNHKDDHDHSIDYQLDHISRTANKLSTNVFNKIHQLTLQTLCLKSKEILYNLTETFCRGHSEISYDLLLKVDDWINQSNQLDIENFDENLTKDIMKTFPVDLIEVDELIKNNINKLKKDIVNDVDMHAQKANQLLEKDESIRNLEYENESIRHELMVNRTKLRDHEMRLVEQQREITQYRREIRKLNQQLLNSNTNNNNNTMVGNWQYNFSAIPQMSPPLKDNNNNLDSNNRRIKSNPPISTNTIKDRRNSLKNDSNRKIRSTPNMLNPEMMVARFHAQSHFLLSEYENNDEVVRPIFPNSDNEHDFINNQENQERPVSRFSKQSGKIPFLSQNSKEENISKFDDNLTTTSDIYKKQIKVSQLKLTDANQKLRDLSINIRLKEQLIKDLVKSAKDSTKVNQDYEDKIRYLENEKDQTNKEVEKLQNKLNEISKSKDNESTEMKKIKELTDVIKEYEKKMELAQKKLGELQKKHKETQKLTQMTSNHDKKVGELMITVDRLKQEQINMQKKLKSESDTKQKLERDLQRDQEKIKQLQIQTEQQQKVLKRKQEEIMAANRKLRRGSSTIGSSDSNPKVEEQRKWMDEEIEKIILYKKQMEDLEMDLKKREEILNKRENLLIERSELYAEKPEEDNQEINQLSVKPENSTNVHLAVERDNLKAQKSRLEEKIKSGFVLSETEERWISELDEAIEALDEAIEYKTESIQNKKEALRQSQINVLMSREDICTRLTQIGPDESRQLLMKYFEKVIDLREKIRKNELIENEKDLQIEELQRIKDHLQRNLDRQTFEFDRRYTQLQANLESEKQVLLHQMALYSGSGDEKSTANNSLSNTPSVLSLHREISILKEKCTRVEREAAVYKKTCRDMKTKIKDWVQTGRLKVDIDISASEIPTQQPQTPKSRPTTTQSEITPRPDTSISHKSQQQQQSVVSSTSIKLASHKQQYKSYDPDNYNKDTQPTQQQIQSARYTHSTGPSQISSTKRSTHQNLVTYSSAEPKSPAIQIHGNSLSAAAKITPVTTTIIPSSIHRSSNIVVNSSSRSNRSITNNQPHNQQLPSEDKTPTPSIIDSLDDK